MKFLSILLLIFTFLPTAISQGFTDISVIIVF
jgi:hypothetical protein